MPASFSDLEQQNPQIRQTLQEWQSARQSNGEDPNDWEAFRQHCQAIGAPDPGSEAPQEFSQGGQGGSGGQGGILGQLGQMGQQAQQQAQQRGGGGILDRLTGQQKQDEAQQR